MRSVYAATLFVLLAVGLLAGVAPAQATSYNMITIDGDLGDWAPDEIFTNFAGTFTDLRVTWDSDYLYFGFNGGGNDKYVVAVDTDPGALGSGYSGSWAGVTFPRYGRPDYIVEYNVVGAPAIFTHNVNAANVTATQSGSATEVRIPRSELGSLSTSTEVAIYMYASSAGDFVFAALGNSNYNSNAIGASPRTITTSFYFPTTDVGRAPNTYFQYQSAIELGKTVTVSASDTFHDVILDGGTLVGPSGAAFNVTGDFHFDATTAGSFTLNNCTVNFRGSGAIKGGHSTGVTFNHVNIAGGATLTADSNFVVLGNWTSGGTFTASAGTAKIDASGGIQTLSGSSTFYNLTLDNAGATTDFGTSSVMVANNLVANAGTMSAGTSTITFTGAAGSISGASTKRFYNLVIASGASVSNSTGGNIEISGDFTNDGSFTQAAARTTTFTKSGTSTLSGAGSTTFGAVTLQGSTTLVPGSHSFGVTGNWTNNGAYTPVAGTVTFGGAAAQSINGSSPTSFYRLTIDNSAGVQLGNTTTVNDLLTLSAGRLTLGGNSLRLGASASAVAGGPFSASNMIVADSAGSVCKRFGAAGSYDYPLGDATGTAEYSPASLNFTGGTFGVNAEACVRVVNAVHPNADTANYTTYISRYWPTTSSNITGFSAVASYTYVDADLTIGGGQSENSLYHWSWNGSTWTMLSAVNPATNTLSSTVTSFSDHTGRSASPLAVSMASFVAENLARGVALRWETVWEHDNVGFNLYRADSVFGPWQKLNQSLIPARAPGSSTGASYLYVDESAASGQPYWYRLDAVDVYGQVSEAGLVSATTLSRNAILFAPRIVR